MANGSMPVRDCAREIKEVRGWLSSRLSNGKVSKQFLRQLTINSHTGFIDLFMFLDRIGELESLRFKTGAKHPEKFRKGPLSGLWHAHWFQASFMAHNLANALEGQTSPPGWKEIWREHSGELMTSSIASKLSAATIRNYEYRYIQKKLTGEWILYAHTPVGNRYLTIARHAEKNADIAMRCSVAAKQFPEVKWTLS